MLIPVEFMTHMQLVGPRSPRSPSALHHTCFTPRTCDRQIKTNIGKRQNNECAHHLLWCESCQEPCDTARSRYTPFAYPLIVLHNIIVCADLTNRNTVKGRPIADYQLGNVSRRMDLLYHARASFVSNLR